MSRLNELTIVEASKKLQGGEITAVDLARACLDEIEKRNPTLNAYLEVFDDVIAQAETADTRRKAGENHPLLGIPFAIKDNILIEGRKVSAASKILEGYVATYDATVIKKLKDAGVVFLGRTNMDEFALGGSTENSAYGPTKNPHDESRVAGGTSGGSAAAVAAHMALGALGTDTGGSVRNPASFCGIVGLKPTYGSVSRFGVIAAASSFDQVGPLAKTVEDVEIIFNTIRGHDVLDSTSTDESLYPKRIQKKTVAVPRLLNIDRELFDTQEVGKKFREIGDMLHTKGYAFSPDIDIPSLGPALAAYYIINFAEVSSNLARFDGVRYGLSLKGGSLLEDYAQSRGEGFGPEARRRILLGTYVLSAGYHDAYYGKAVAAREQLQREYKEAFENIDVILTPTMPTVAWVVGEKSDPMSMYLADAFTVPANLTGNPAISIPTVRSKGELPMGIQLTAAHGDESALFRVGKDIEQTNVSEVQ